MRIFKGGFNENNEYYTRYIAVDKGIFLNTAILLN